MDVLLLQELSRKVIGYVCLLRSSAQGIVSFGLYHPPYVIVIHHRIKVGGRYRTIGKQLRRKYAGKESLGTDGIAGIKACQGIIGGKAVKEYSYDANGNLMKELIKK